MSPHVSAPITSLQYPFQPWPYCPGRRVARVACRSDEQQHSRAHRVPRSRIHRTGYLRIIGCSTDIRHAPLTDAPPSSARAQTWSLTGAYSGLRLRMQSSSPSVKPVWMPEPQVKGKSHCASNRGYTTRDKYMSRCQGEANTNPRLRICGLALVLVSRVQRHWWQRRGRREGLSVDQDLGVDVRVCAVVRGWAKRIWAADYECRILLTQVDVSTTKTAKRERAH